MEEPADVEAELPTEPEFTGAADLDPPSDPVESPEVACDAAVDVAPPATLEGATVYVIDANSLIFQVFHAIAEMTSPKGEPVSAVFGFTRDLFFLREQKQPTYLFAAFDRAEPTFRHDMYETYKGTRSEMPADLSPQFEHIVRVLEAMNVAVIDCPRFEADDILATVATQVDALGGECFLVTGDKDSRQLITDRVKIYNIRKDQVYDAAALQADWGIRPDQVVDFQSLVGDSVDNIPGVPLIGPKIAGELLQKYDTLDNLLAKADELPKGKRKENLINFREQALLSRRLVELDRQAPIAIDWAKGRVGGVNRDQLLALFQEYGFHSLAQKIGALPAERVEAKWEANYVTIDTPEKFDAFLQDLKQQTQFSFDTETTSIAPREAEIVGYSFSWTPGLAYYLPVRAPVGEARLDPTTTLEALRPVLENPEIKKVGQNLKYDIIVLRSAGVRMRGTSFDTMVASYLLDAGERNHNLDELARRYLNHTNITIESLIGTGKNQCRMDEVAVKKVSDYAAEDADVAGRLVPILAKPMSAAGLDNLFDELEMPLVDVLVELEYNGIRIDTARLAELSKKYGKLLSVLEKDIYDLAGHEFNIGSPKQLQQVLFVEQKLPTIKKTKTGGSTDVEVLEELARQHPLPAKIIEYRQYAKLKSTYVDALPTMVYPATGRVHASFNQGVAATGRLSSSDPNLQNIPVRNESGREIRAAFLPGQDGWKLLAADYSQIELRVLAHFSQDEALCASFARDEDIHTRVASEVHGVPLESVSKEMRRTAKAVNFGVIYGQSPFGLAKTLDIPQDEAARFINAYFDRYAGVEKLLTKILEDCQRDGYVSTILGRRRAINGIKNTVGRQRNLPERTAINTVIQGSAADIIKRAMINIYRRLENERWAAKMLLQIHDELIFEAPAEEIDKLAELVVAEMSGVMPLSVPLKVDVKSGVNWAACEPM